MEENDKTPMMNQRISTKQKKKLPTRRRPMPTTARGIEIDKMAGDYYADTAVNTEKAMVKKGAAIEEMGGADFTDTAMRIRSGLDVAETMSKPALKNERISSKKLRKLPKKK
jgi:hypothetical protein